MGNQLHIHKSESPLAKEGADWLRKLISGYKANTTEMGSHPTPT